jgi:N-acetylglucosaminyldiphosphoundecaprenol N-acetyl-beta-D-mannosaminyltransferase
VCKLSVERGYRNFFFGGNDGVAQLLAEKLVARFPGLLVAGTYTPPFRPLHSREEEELISQVNACRPDVLWVGLSTPRQEKFMARYVDRLGVPLLVGVGAAFDIHTDRVREAPRWMMRLGMQWFHRLLQEPRRLWRRYLVNNPKFLFRITAQLLRSRAAL